MTSLLIISIYLAVGIYGGVGTYNKLIVSKDNKKLFCIIVLAIGMAIWPLVVIGCSVFNNRETNSKGGA